MDPSIHQPPRKSYESTGNCDGIAPVDWTAATPERIALDLFNKLNRFDLAVTFPDATDPDERLPNHNLNVCAVAGLHEVPRLVFSFPACGWLLHGEGFDDFRRGISPTYAGKPVAPGMFIRDDAEAHADELRLLLAFVEHDADNERIRALAWDQLAGRIERAACGWYAARQMADLRRRLLAPRPHGTVLFRALTGRP